MVNIILKSMKMYSNRICQKGINKETTAFLCCLSGIGYKEKV